MQNWLGVGFVAVAALVVGAQIGRRGLAGAFRPVPLAFVLSSVIIVWRLGLAVTPRHIFAAIALFGIGGAVQR